MQKGKTQLFIEYQADVNKKCRLRDTVWFSELLTLMIRCAGNLPY